MKKKIIYGIMLCIILIGAIVIGVMGLEVDIDYSKNVRLGVYLGKQFDNNEMKELAQEVFGKDRTIVQKVEYYGDMALITIKQENADNIDEKVKQLNDKINEKYDLKNEVDSIEVTYQPKMRLYTVLLPYILPLAISSVIILVYVMVRYRKLGVFKTLGLYLLSIFAVEALYLSILAIFRIPVNRLVVPIGLLIYIVVVTIVTAIKEKNYQAFIEENKKK